MSFHPHPLVVRKIFQLVDTGLTKVNDIKVLLDTFLKAELLQDAEAPLPLNRRYFPDDNIIRKIVYK